MDFSQKNSLILEYQSPSYANDIERKIKLEFEVIRSKQRRGERKCRLNFCRINVSFKQR